MKKTNDSHKIASGAIGGIAKAVHAQNGGTKGHSKPSTGGTHAGPPPPPKPAKK